MVVLIIKIPTGLHASGMVSDIPFSLDTTLNMQVTGQLVGPASTGLSVKTAPIPLYN